jgi:hypothetical protein
VTDDIKHGTALGFIWSLLILARLMVLHNKNACVYKTGSRKPSRPSCLADSLCPGI